MIKALEIENFKGIGERQRIEFAPVTLLFGPNSAGKSTIMQALIYAEELLAGEDPNTDETLKGGEYLRLGGFGNFVHRREKFRTVSIKLELPFAPLLPMWPFDYEDIYCEGSDSLGDHFNLCNGSYSLEVSVAWSEHESRPMVSSYRVELDGIWIADLEAASDCARMQISRINWVHPNLLFRKGQLQPILDDINRGRSESGASELEARNFAPETYAPGFPDELLDVSRGLDLGRVRLFLNGHSAEVDDLQLSEWYAVSELASMLGEAVTGQNSRLKGGGLPLSIANPCAVFPVSDEASDDPLEFDEEQWPGFSPKDDEHICVREALGYMICVPKHLLSFELGRIIRIGPLRAIPERQHASRVESTRWAEEYEGWPEGMGAWDYLSHASESELDSISNWLAKTDCLDTGYYLKRIELGGGEAGELDQRSRIVLVDTATGVEFFLRDVGMGISQIIPVVVAACASKWSIVCIEQPELHMHPRSQGGLGDLFIRYFTPLKSKDGFFAVGGSSQCILETHSEHLLLRVLRRIRESSEKNLDLECRPVRPGDVSINVIEKVPSGLRVRRLDVNEEGDFEGDWPEGFFEERNEELF